MRSVKQRSSGRCRALSIRPREAAPARQELIRNMPRFHRPATQASAAPRDRHHPPPGGMTPLPARAVQGAGGPTGYAAKFQALTSPAGVEHRPTAARRWVGPAGRLSRKDHYPAGMPHSPAAMGTKSRDRLYGTCCRGAPRSRQTRLRRLGQAHAGVKRGTGILKIGKALGIGTGTVQRILMEQPRPFDVGAAEAALAVNKAEIAAGGL